MNGNCFWLSALMVVVGAGVGRAIESVDFKAAAAGLAASYEEARPGTVTAEEVRWDFNPGAPLFAGFPRLYRGVRVRSSGNTLGEKSTLLRLHDNEPPSWPDRPELFWQPSDTSGAITITWLWFFFVQEVGLCRRTGRFGGATGGQPVSVEYPRVVGRSRPGRRVAGTGAVFGEPGRAVLRLRSRVHRGESREVYFA